MSHRYFQVHSAIHARRVVGPSCAGYRSLFAWLADLATLFRRGGYPKNTFRPGDFYKARAKCSCYPKSSFSSQGGCLASRHFEYSVVHDYSLLGYFEPKERRASKVGHAIAGLLNQKGEPQFKFSLLMLIGIPNRNPWFCIRTSPV
jgi:hypothetical protein